MRIKRRCGWRHSICRRSAAHPFYKRLNQILDEHDFDRYVEGLCERFNADEGRPGLPPGWRDPGGHRFRHL